MPIDDWEVRMSISKGLPYFFNKQSKTSLWDKPPELTEEEAKHLPGYEHVLNVAQAAASSRPGQVRASHLLVKHKDSRRPSSWKENNITRTKEEAIEILRGYQTEINGSPDTFAKLASEHSDCSSHSNNGDLGWFGKGQMQKPFEDGTFALEVGKMSDVISTDSGVHLILRTG
ncbi:hypothetical protein CPB83DRAFT_848339 [Crepidotus variabilis]|uniref:Peptidyl-prolyl cis-trans isomerase n=1 Tax=Crepidotus variabilis TaxID=179855 RepID=A0A9P6JSL9_9AGAR|nr:hypothetical protein CPB83DRAFT_848339 [Crepidotus variabilis]